MFIFYHTSAFIVKCCRDERFCDVILTASLKPEDGAESDGNRDVRIVAHRAVLAAACPYFSAMFKSAMKESKQQNIFLKVIFLFKDNFGKVCPHSYYNSYLGNEHLCHFLSIFRLRYTCIIYVIFQLRSFLNFFN